MSNGGGVGVGAGLFVFTVIFLLLNIGYGVESWRATIIALFFGAVVSLFFTFGHPITE